jgi:hypothetical protein
MQVRAEGRAVHEALWEHQLRQLAELALAEPRRQRSGVANWSKIRFVVDFRNLLFGRDFDLSFSKGYSRMKFFNL